VSGKPIITGIELHEIDREVRDYGSVEGYPRYEPGTAFRQKQYAVRILTDVGLVGEYVAGLIDTASVRMFAHLLIGQNALEREKIYHEVKRALRQVSRIGLAPVDIALWDIAGKYYGAPIYELLGGYRTRLPCYASTTIGGDPGGLDSPEAYADFAEQCRELGYRAFKAHTWQDAPIAQEAELVRALGRRVGGTMDLMIDPACRYDTFGDALKVGHACDEAGFFWLEDPFQDGGISYFAHRKLRELIKTPLLQGEHVRGLEPRVEFLLAGATDYVRGDAPLDGITATMKLAHAAEGLGIDVELHGGGPATRHCMAAMRNSNYYEWGLVHPRITRRGNPLYKDGFVDGQLDGVDADGCIPVPPGPGLGVEYDWDFIAANRTGIEKYPR
jgi:L-alanine-DL-glutamate epimerase-like enolase superfamily enzyme